MLGIGRGRRGRRDGPDAPEAPPPPAPFIVGVPRSGTTLLRLMLDSHPELAIPAETHFVPLLIERWRELRRAGAGAEERRHAAFELITSHPRWPDLGIEAEVLRERLFSPGRLGLGDAVRSVYLAHAALEGKQRWGDKSPGYLTKMNRIQQAVEEARFVHVLRDGRAVACSLGEVSWGTDDVEEAARSWKRRIATARRQAEKLTAGSYLEIRYEDLVTDPEPTLRRVAEAIELPWDTTMLEYHTRAAERMAVQQGELHSRRGRTITAAERERQHALVSEPPRPDRIDRWREQMAPADRDRFEAVAAGLLAELGYPVDDR